jgi:hypothetical protein
LDEGVRICLGFVAIYIGFFDIENLIENAGMRIVYLKSKLKELNQNNDDIQ